jgi:hypothetical protein
MLDWAGNYKLYAPFPRAPMRLMLTFLEGLLVTSIILLGAAACSGGGSSATAAQPPTEPPPMTTGAPAITSEADSILHLDQIRAAGFRGAGVRVGVISTGIVNLASYQNAQVIPRDLYVSQNFPGPLDEGSWMLELIHQHAPDALLGFCDGKDLDFHGCIKDLAQNFHADVIVDDLLFSGQFYPDATAGIVTQLEAANDRLVFIHLSGNEQHGGYWEGPFALAQAPIAGVVESVLDFGVASGGNSDIYNSVTLPAGDRLTLILNWNDPPHGAANHALSAVLLDDSVQVLDRQSGQSEPTLIVRYTNTNKVSQTVHLAVTLDGGGNSDGLAVQVTEGSATCNIECQPLTHATAGLAGGTVGDFPDALVVGSTFVRTPMQLDTWTNRGPFQIDFQATPDASAADGYDYVRLSPARQINKPDLVAPDCVTVPFSDGTTVTNNQFCGTSAAVPAVAAAAALLQSAGFNRAQVLKALRSTAIPLGSATWDPGYGFGLVDAAAAYRSGGR